MKKRILLLMMTALLSVGAWAVDDISLSVVKAGMSPNWAASVSDENVVTLNCGGAVEWALFPAISTANYTGVEVVFAAAPTIAEGQSVSLSVYYEGEDEAVSTTYESGTTLSATFAADKKVSMVALTTGWSEQGALHATFTLSSATIKGASGAATAPSANLSLPFSKITAPAGWGLTIPENTQNIVISQYSSAGWTFTTAVKTTDYTGINLTLTQAPDEGGSITIKYDGADDQTISVNASTTSVVADFDKTGTVTGIYFNGDGYHDPDNPEDLPLGDLTYIIGNCYLVVASAETPTEPTTDNVLEKDDSKSADTNDAHTDVYTLGTGDDAKTLTVSVEKTEESENSGTYNTNGTISASATTTGDVTTVTLTPNPATGYKLNKLIVEKVMDAGQADAPRRANSPGVGNYVETTKDDDGNYSFTMPDANVTVTALFAEKPVQPTMSYDKPTRTITITNTAGSAGKLHYKLNSGDGQMTTGESASEVITVNTTVTAWITNISDDEDKSDEVEETFNVTAAPTATVNTENNTVTLQLTTGSTESGANTAVATLYYTTNGSDPTTSSSSLTSNGTIDITEDMTTVKMLAVDADGNYSEIATQPVSYTYYLTASKEWTTYYHNYSKTFSVPAGLKAYIVTSVTAPADGQSGTIEVAEQQVIAPNTPMLIYNEGATTTSYMLTVTEDQTISGTASEFKGVDTDYTIPNDGKARYILVNGVFTRTVSGTLKAHRCYLELNASSTPANPAPQFIISIGGGDGTTGIGNIQRATSDIEHYYNLNGQRVDQPTKGLYIVNGKKVVIR